MQKTTAIDYMPMDAFSSFDMIRNGNARETNKTRQYNKDTGLVSRMGGLVAINKPVTAGAAAGGALNQTNPNAQMPLAASSHGTMADKNFGFGGFPTQVLNNYDVRATSNSMAAASASIRGSTPNNTSDGFLATKKSVANSLARTNLDPMQASLVSQASVKNPPSLFARTSQNTMSAKNLDATTGGGFGGGVVRSGGFQRAMKSD